MYACVCVCACVSVCRFGCMYGRVRAVWTASLWRCVCVCMRVCACVSVCLNVGEGACCADGITMEACVCVSVRERTVCCVGRGTRTRLLRACLCACVRLCVHVCECLGVGEGVCCASCVSWVRALAPAFSTAIMLTLLCCVLSLLMVLCCSGGQL